MFWCFSNFSQYLPYAQEKKLQMIGYTDKDILIYFKTFSTFKKLKPKDNHVDSVFFSVTHQIARRM